MDAGKRVFAYRGNHGASIRAIAAVAGVHPATVNYHFGSKRGLYECTIEYCLDRLHRDLNAVANSPGMMRCTGKLAKLVRATAEYFLQDPAGTRLVLRWWNDSRRADRDTSPAAVRWAVVLGTMAKEIEAMATRDRMYHSTPRHLAEIIVSYILCTAIIWHAAPDPADRPSAVDVGTELVRFAHDAVAAPPISTGSGRRHQSDL